jgi:hypothetical protein
LKTAARDNQRKASDSNYPEAAAVVNCCRDDDTADKASANDFCCCAEISNNLNLQAADSHFAAPD